MNFEKFNELFEIERDDEQKQNISFGEVISPEECSAISLRLVFIDGKIRIESDQQNAA